MQEKGDFFQNYLTDSVAPEGKTVKATQAKPTAAGTFKAEVDYGVMLSESGTPAVDTQFINHLGTGSGEYKTK